MIELIAVAVAAAALTLCIALGVLLLRRSKVTPNGVSLDYFLEQMRAADAARAKEVGELAGYFGSQVEEVGARNDRVVERLAGLLREGHQSTQAVVGALAAVKGPQVIYPPQAPPERREKPSGRTVMNDENEARVEQGLEPIEEFGEEGVAQPHRLNGRTLANEIVAAELHRRGGAL